MTASAQAMSSSPGKTFYAIGDVHGEAARLETLHGLILEDIARRGGPALVVHLGDLVDRGPDSRGAVAAVIKFEKIAALQDGVESICLRGNHEQMMLDAFDRAHSTAEEHWFSNGGLDCVNSYIRAHRAANALDWRKLIDEEHLSWLRGLGTIARDEAAKVAFVHAGIDPVTFPDCKDEIRVWTRSPRFFRADHWPQRKELDGWRIIHGHTPTRDSKPEVAGRRINVDTGAVFGGPLTCVVLSGRLAPTFLSA
jgi:serine/threonine protein phosphatase 1